MFLICGKFWIALIEWSIKLVLHKLSCLHSLYRRLRRVGLYKVHVHQPNHSSDKLQLVLNNRNYYDLFQYALLTLTMGDVDYSNICCSYKDLLLLLLLLHQLFRNTLDPLHYHHLCRHQVHFGYLHRLTHPQYSYLGFQNAHDLDLKSPIFDKYFKFN